MKMRHGARRALMTVVLALVASAAGSGAGITSMAQAEDVAQADASRAGEAQQVGPAIEGPATGVIGTVAGPDFILSNDRPEFEAHATDPHGGRLAYSWTVVGDAVIVGRADMAVVRLQADDGVGEVRLMLTVTTSAGGVATATRTYSIKPHRRNDSFLSGFLCARVSEGEGTKLCELVDHDRDGNPLTITDISYTSPQGLRIRRDPADPLLLRLRGLDGPAQAKIVATVTDRFGTASESELFVSVLNDNPRFDSITVEGDHQAACAGGNEVRVMTNPDDDGAFDLPTLTASVDWGDGSPVQDLPRFSYEGRHRYDRPGRYTLTFTAADKDGGTIQTTRVVTIGGYEATGILEPVKADGSSTFRRKAGSTIPVKVRITDCDGQPVTHLAPQIGTTQESQVAPNTPIEETGSTSAADTTGRMRHVGDGMYLYNLATESLPVGTHTIVVRDALTDGGQRAAQVHLR